MLQAQALAVERGGKPLFSDISFSMQAGDLMHVSGMNGTGKTTLLRMLCGLTLPSEGSLLWQQKDIHKHRDNFNSELLYIGHRSGMFGDLTAVENLKLASSTHNDDDSQIQAALTEIGLGPHSEKPMRLLSQGQQRRVSLARLLLEERKLWILDEPLTALDVNAVDWLVAHIIQHADNGGMAILTTHQQAAFIERVSVTVAL